MNDGGPAFPFSPEYDHGIEPSSGMTLRDWLAGQALAAGIYAPPGATSRWAHTAEEAYRQADAMLAEREKK